MWLSEALQALGVIVFLTVVTTVDAFSSSSSESSSSGSSDIPGEMISDTNYLSKDERTSIDRQSTTVNNIEEWNTMKLNSNINETMKIEDNYDNDNLITQEIFLQSTIFYLPIVDSETKITEERINRTDRYPSALDRSINVVDNPVKEISQFETGYRGELFEPRTNRSNIDDSITDINGGSTIEQILPPDNARAISFQIPPNSDENENENEDLDENGNEDENENEKDVKRISSGENFLTDIDKSSLAIGSEEVVKKDRDNGDRNRQSDKNQVVNKPAKAFYEIKSLVTTEAVIDADMNIDTNQNSNQRKFILPTIPWMASSIGKYGPYFEDGAQEKNITARIGSTVLLDCKIGMLHDKTVTWLQHSKDSIHLLTVARQVYSADQRVSLSFRYPSNWRLQILYASLRDSGVYECQVATHPPRIKKINLIVTAPVLTIVDDAGRVVAAGERHLKAGSILKLSCEARDVRESDGEAVVWTRGDETLVENVSENKTTENLGGDDIHVVVSTVSVERASPRHAGNYTCSVPGRTKSTVVVHVLNGELPAAVHDGNGVSRAVLNFWLVHLTISYVFSR